MPQGSGYGTSGALTTVSTNSTLTGSGTSGSPLGVVSWPLTSLIVPGIQNNNITLGAANQIYGTGFVLDYSLTFASVLVNVAATDAGNNYDFGIYTKAGALVANRTPGTLASGGNQTFNFTQGSQTIAPGLYVFAMTGAATTGKLSAAGTTGTWVTNNNIGSSTNATLPNSISAVTVSANTLGFWFVLY